MYYLNLLVVASQHLIACAYLDLPRNIESHMYELCP